VIQYERADVDCRGENQHQRRPLPANSRRIDQQMADKKGLLAEFKDFIATGDLMSIAVAFIMGAAVKAVIDSFVGDIVTGLIGLVIPCKDITLPDGTVKAKADCSGIAGEKWKSVKWGSFINQIINFLIIAFVVFMMVKAYKKMTNKGLAQDGPSDNDLLKEIRDSLKSGR
jgi:large conductance mechanosensitive channel